LKVWAWSQHWEQFAGGGVGRVHGRWGKGVWRFRATNTGRGCNCISKKTGEKGSPEMSAVTFKGQETRRERTKKLYKKDYCVPWGTMNTGGGLWTKETVKETKGMGEQG